MKALPQDPIQPDGIAEFGQRLRRGEITCESATKSYLKRIAVLNPKLDAYVYVAEDRALEMARAIDSLLASGTDLGPLMGIPVAVKDLLTVKGMPTTAGSNLDIEDLVEPEGAFVQALKRAGCVILGKTRTTEFAAGMQNVNHPTPWNPWDSTIHKTPGGSSSGSAVAQAAGLCAFAIGSDTGGSVRLPAAFCGVFGLKTSFGLWPLDGVFPLCPAMDTLGLLTNSATDAALIFSALTGKPVPLARPLNGLRLGKPLNHFYNDLDSAVQTCMEQALDALGSAGVEFVSIEVSDVEEINDLFGLRVSADLLATIGRERFLAEQNIFDPVVIERLKPALDLPATDYISLFRRQQALAQTGPQKMEGLDGWITPTTKILPQPVASLTAVEAAGGFTSRGTLNTRPGNMYNLCAATIPLFDKGTHFPVGLQIYCESDHDTRLLSISQAVEQRMGILARPEVAAFL